MLSGNLSTTGPQVIPAQLPAARLLTNDSDILAARRLYVTEHLKIGYLEPDVVAADGTLIPQADPWLEHSRYFGAFDPDGTMRAACRLILDTAPDPLPTMQLDTVDLGMRRTLEALPVGSLAEVASLAAQPGAGRAFPRALFRAMWRDGMARGETAWVLNVDAPVLRTLRTMDAELFRIIGRSAPAPVRPVLPVMLWLADANETIFPHNLPSELVVLP
jgi:hypothetical protein